MKYIPYYISILGFFLTLLFSYLTGSYFGIEWLVFYNLDTASGGFKFEAGISWIPILMALFIAYMGWKIGFKRLPDEISEN
ncbi:MAG: hypothetical protein ACQESU_03830 [Halobacteriota archaeon]